ncbi:MAG: class I SAM-dependent rRNA methyltransferase [Phycisphaerae bacterium]|nr:class I SAM-dependent rRNA methyltransferase [Phycisphaerae bacterium]
MGYAGNAKGTSLTLHNPVARAPGSLGTSLTLHNPVARAPGSLGTSLTLHNPVACAPGLLLGRLVRMVCWVGWFAWFVEAVYCGGVSGAFMNRQFTRSVETAWSARAPLRASGVTDALRLINGEADGFPGLVIEQLGDVLIAQVHEQGSLASRGPTGKLPVHRAATIRERRGKLSNGVAPACPPWWASRRCGSGATGDSECYLDETAIRQVAEEILRRTGARAVYRKFFVRDRGGLSRDTDTAHRDPQPWLGEPVEAERAITEHGLRYIVRPYAGFAVGLFLDHRDNRLRIRERAAGRRVLNAFSYTGAFSVAAAAGSAASVSSVDLSKRYLEWSRENFAANGLDQSGHWFFCSDIFEFYKRAERQGRRFDLVILDPPTFSRPSQGRRAFVLAERLDELVAGAVRLLDPGGEILLASNQRDLPLARLEESLLAAAGRRSCTILERPPLPADFAGDADYAKSVIVRYG